MAELGLEGELQVASFHPQYRFAGTQSEDIENYTNRSPYPMLHLLREASIERAVAAVPDPDEIYRRNIRTLRNLGHDGLAATMARLGLLAHGNELDGLAVSHSVMDRRRRRRSRAPHRA